MTAATAHGNVRKAAQPLSACIFVGRQDLAGEGRVREATWAVIDAAFVQLDTALADLERLDLPRVWGRR